MDTIENIKEDYKDEWVLVEIITEDDKGRPIDVELLKHSKNRDDIYDALKLTKRKYTFQFYTGSITKKGYAVAFYDGPYI